MTETLVLRAAIQPSHGWVRRLGDRAFAAVFSGLVYPQVWEDPEVDLEALALAPGARLIAIASAGCNIASYLLADPGEVVAVDLNRHHLGLLALKLGTLRAARSHAELFRSFGCAISPGRVDFLRQQVLPLLEPQWQAYWLERRGGRPRLARLAGNPYRCGALGRTIRFGHFWMSLFGGDPRRLLAATTPEEREQIFAHDFARVLRAPATRLLLALPLVWFGLGVPPHQLERLRAEADGDLAAVVEARLRRLLLQRSMDDNWFAHQALTLTYGRALPPWLRPEAFDLLRQRADRVRARHIDVTTALAEEPECSFDGYVLLDAQDWMDDITLAGLWRQIRRTARPGARIIFRTLSRDIDLERRLPPWILDGFVRKRERAAELYARDRSGVYGGFHIWRREDRP